MNENNESKIYQDIGENDFDNSKQHKKRYKKFIVCIAFGILLLTLAVMKPLIIPEIKYRQANDLYQNSEFSKAQEKYEELGNYKDSASKAEKAKADAHTKWLNDRKSSAEETVKNKVISYIKNSLNNPDSMKVNSISVNPVGDNFDDQISKDKGSVQYTVKIDYSAQNSYGGMARKDEKIYVYYYLHNNSAEINYVSILPW